MSNKDVTVTIDIQKPIGRLGFGKPLIIGSKVEGHEYKEYPGLEAVKEDFAAATEEYKAAKAIFDQGDNAPEIVAITCRNSSATAEKYNERLVKAMDKDWNFLLITSSLIADVIAVAEVIETDESRMFAAHLTKEADLTSILAKKYSQTFVMYHSDNAIYPEAAWVGTAGSLPVGSITWKFKKLVGIEPLSVSALQLKTIHDSGANTYLTKAGDDVTSEGKVVSGEYIDVIHARNFIVASIENEVQKLMNKSPKIAYTDAGIAQIESAVKAVLQRAFNQGIIASDEFGGGLYGTSFKQRGDIDPVDRAQRIYDGGTFWFEIAGAIHKAKIKGTITF